MLVVALGITTIPVLLVAQWLPQFTSGTIALQGPQRKAAVALSDDNIYVAWITNRTGSNEVVFRSSNDAGGTFNDKIILSNTTNVILQDIQILSSYFRVARQICDDDEGMSDVRYILLHIG